MAENREPRQIKPIPVLGKQVKVKGWTYPPKPVQPRTNTVGENLTWLRNRAGK